MSKTCCYGSFCCVGIPAYAYEPSHFSPFLKGACASYLVHTDGNLRIEILRRPIVFTLGKRAKSDVYIHSTARSDKIRRCTRRSSHVL